MANVLRKEVKQKDREWWLEENEGTISLYCSSDIGASGKLSVVSIVNHNGNSKIVLCKKFGNLDGYRDTYRPNPPFKEDGNVDILFGLAKEL